MECKEKCQLDNKYLMTFQTHLLLSSEKFIIPCISVCVKNMHACYVLLEKLVSDDDILHLHENEWDEEAVVRVIESRRA
jgi:hypothetical protein